MESLLQRVRGGVLVNCIHEIERLTSPSADRLLEWSQSQTSSCTYRCQAVCRASEDAHCSFASLQ